MKRRSSFRGLLKAAAYLSGTRRKRIGGSLAVGLSLSALLAWQPAVPVKALGTGGAYVSLAPVRILDTRDGTGGVPIKPLGEQETLDFAIAGKGGVPSDATAVVINATVTDGTAASYLTIYPAGATRPLASNLNWTPRKFAIANLVEVGLGLNKQVSIYNAAGSVDVIFDVAGYVSSSPPSGTGLYEPLVPTRILDTRDGTGSVPAAPLASDTSLTLQVSGHGGVPAMGAAGVVLNLTVTRPTGPGYLGVYPSDQARPVVSNVNFDAGETIANRVAVRLSQNGRVTVFGREEGVTLSSHVDIVVDVAGWFTDSSNAAAAGSTFVPLAPFRILDTRDGTGGFPVSRVGPQQSIPVQVAGRGGVPLMTDAQPPNAVVVNLTATGGSQGSYATIWPDGATRPTTSDLNWSSGETIPNLVVAGLGGSGIADLFNAAGCTHVVVDVVGYYTGPQVAPAAAALTGIPDCPPEARTRAAIAYDAARHEVVVFGGVSAEGHVFDDTWTWDGKIWTDRTVRPGPSARTEASMAYDATSQSVVLFGGSTGDPNQPLLSDTWTWDGKNWTARSPATRPPPNGHFPMAYDAARGKVLLLALPYPFDQPQTWTWDGAGWTLEHPAVQPPWNYDANMAYDSTRGRIVLFGGWHNTIAQSDTWTWDGSNWTDAAPAVAPPARFNAGLADDPVLHQLVLFGGNGGNNDTWAWNGVTWAKLSPPNSPPPISSGSMVGDPQAGLVLLFGGFQNYQPSPLSGTWVWDGSNWSPRF